MFNWPNALSFKNGSAQNWSSDILGRFGLTKHTNSKIHVIGFTNWSSNILSTYLCCLPDQIHVYLKLTKFFFLFWLEKQFWTGFELCMWVRLYWTCLIHTIYTIVQNWRSTIIFSCHYRWILLNSKWRDRSDFENTLWRRQFWFKHIWIKREPPVLSVSFIVWIRQMMQYTSDQWFPCWAKIILLLVVHKVINHDFLERVLLWKEPPITNVLLNWSSRILAIRKDTTFTLAWCVKLHEIDLITSCTRVCLT